MVKRIIIIGLLIIISSIKLSGSQTTKTGVDLIKFFEGFRAKAYKCPANVLTIGYGHTGNDIDEGMIITKAEAEMLLIKDLLRFEKYVDNVIWRFLRWHEFDALVSFTFNVGYRIKGNLREAVSRGDTKTTTYLLMQFNKAKVNGSYVILSGLVKRRKAEEFLYRTGNEKILREKFLGIRN